MLQSLITSRATVQQPDQNTLDCQGDDSSCLSKDDGFHFCGSDDKNVTSSAASVSSSCANNSETSVNDRSLRSSSPANHMSVEHGDQNAPRDYKNSSKPDLLMLGSADGLKSDSPVIDIGKPHLLRQDMMNEDDSDELVDVCCL